MLGLPFEYFMLMLILCMAPMIWARGLYGFIVAFVWLAVVYGVLRYFASRDEQAVKAFFKGQKAVPSNLSKSIFGGVSFGP